MKSIEKISNQKASLDEIRGLVSEEWSLLDQEIKKQLSSDIELINNVSQYIVNSGGKESDRLWFFYRQKLEPQILIVLSKRQQ